MSDRKAVGDVIVSDKAAGSWVEGYPIGNGRLGAVVLGDVTRERVSLNHDRLWRRYWRHQDHGVARLVPLYRKLCLEKRWDEAYELMKSKIAISGDAIYVNPFVPLGDMGIYPRFKRDGEVTGYRRELDMSTGVVTVSYNVGGIAYRRESFVSWPAGVIVVRLSADRAAAINAGVSLYRMVDPECRVRGTGTTHELALEGEFEEGVRFAAVVRAVPRSGRMTCGLRSYEQGDVRPVIKTLGGFTFGFRDEPHPPEPSGVSTYFDAANEGLLLVALATDRETDDPAGYCRRRLDAVPADFDRLRDEHVQDHQRFYGRVSLSLGDTPSKPTTTDALVDEARATGKTRPLLVEQLFNVGRYLAIASGRAAASDRPYKAPINLQGIWNEDPRPAWDSDYHLDLNLEMCYWAMGIANLGEMYSPLADWALAMLDQAKRIARDLYGVSGALYSMGDADNLGNIDDLGMLATGPNAWLSQSLWQAWEYRRDEVELRHKIYPVMREIGRFYEEFLIEDDQGRLIPVPSGSPEICPTGRKYTTMLSAPSTFDLELIRQLFENLLEAGALLGLDADRYEKWKEILRKLPMPVLDAKGCLLEWMEDYEVTDPGHRHRSHFVGILPGDRITEEDTPEYNEGIRKALARRHAGGKDTGCSLTIAMDAQIHARLYEGSRVMEQLHYLTTHHVMGNGLMCLCNWRLEDEGLHWFKDRKIFQIEASFETLWAITEMFLQDRRGLLRLLPAVPRECATGAVRGLQARGGFEVDIEWSDGKLTSARIRSHRGGPCRVKSFTTKGKLEVSRRGGSASLTPRDGIIEFQTEAGESYFIRPV
jgi:alpha-L-fucosidase 2